MLHHQRGGEALEILSELSASPHAAVLAFDETTRVRDAVRLQTYFALLQLGKKEEALQTLRDLAEDKNAAPFIRPMAELLLSRSDK